MFGQFLNIPPKLILMPLYYQYYHFSLFNCYIVLLSVLLFIFNYLFCYFIIPLFYYTCFNCLKLAFLCYHLAFFLMLGHSTAYFVFYILLVFYLTLLYDFVLFKVSLHTYFKVKFLVFLCAVIDVK